MAGATALIPLRHVAFQPGLPPGARPWLVLERQPRLLGEGDYLVVGKFGSRGEAVACTARPVHYFLRHSTLGWYQSDGGFTPEPGAAAWLSLSMARELSALVSGAVTLYLHVFALLGTGELQPWPAAASCEAACHG